MKSSFKVYSEGGVLTKSSLIWMAKEVDQALFKLTYTNWYEKTVHLDDLCEKGIPVFR